MSRARTNWRRLQTIRGGLARYQAAFKALQAWDSPLASLAALACTTLLCFYPHAALACLLLSLMLHSLLMYRCLPAVASLAPSTTTCLCCSASPCCGLAGR